MGWIQDNFALLLDFPTLKVDNTYMSSGLRSFDSNFYYHIYNCGVAKQNVFFTNNDYLRFLDTISFYLYKQVISYSHHQRLNEEAMFAYNKLHPKSQESRRVNILSYCPMPNHFHLLAKPIKENAVSQFIADITNSYTRYINTKHERIGSLFQGTYRSKEIRDDESVLQVTRYIHLNPTFSSKTNPRGNLKKPEDYPYSSYKEWLIPNSATLVDKRELSKWLELAGGALAYKEFVEAKIDKNPKGGIEDLVLE
ncbi:MAG: transposase [Candidatus Cloacimonetes bacterium]|nr:transposase [Candidatus Cloacimonadota bacterium]